MDPEYIEPKLTPADFEKPNRAKTITSICGALEALMGVDRPAGFKPAELATPAPVSMSFARTSTVASVEQEELFVGYMSDAMRKAVLDNESSSGFGLGYNRTPDEVARAAARTAFRRAIEIRSATVQEATIDAGEAAGDAVLAHGGSSEDANMAASAAYSAVLRDFDEMGTFTPNPTAL